MTRERRAQRLLDEPEAPAESGQRQHRDLDGVLAFIHRRVLDLLSNILHLSPPEFERGHATLVMAATCSTRRWFQPRSTTGAFGPERGWNALEQWNSQ